MDQHFEKDQKERGCHPARAGYTLPWPIQRYVFHIAILLALRGKTRCNAHGVRCIAPLSLSSFGVRVARICVYLLPFRQVLKYKTICIKMQWFWSPTIAC